VKIQTQARLLVIGLVLVPQLIIITNIVSHRLFDVGKTSDLPIYEDILALLNDRISIRDWESIVRLAAISWNNAELTIFRDDYLVLYSTIHEFAPGAFATREAVLSMVGGECQQYTHVFGSVVLEDGRVYILAKVTSPPDRSELFRFFIPALLAFLFFIVLAIFAACMSIIIVRTITGSVRVLEDATRRIAGGELDLNVDAKGNNEITSLANSLNRMRNALKEDALRRSRLIMGITHDLKTPLTLIKGYAEAIEDGIADDPASRTEATEIIIAKTDQLEGMINDLLNYVRIETGEWRAKLEDVDLSAFLQNMANVFRNDAELLQHTLVHDINLPKNVFAPMDKRLALRAFENLAHNAVRHTPNGSVIRISAVKVENAVELTVSDNGPGINKKDLPHVFEMFYRSSSSRREQGMGLGLAVVKWVADYHGWSVSVSSERGEGTCFVVCIPVSHNPVLS